MPRVGILNLFIGFLAIFWSGLAGFFLSYDAAHSFVQNDGMVHGWYFTLAASAHGHTNLFGMLHILLGLTIQYPRTSLPVKITLTTGLTLGTLAMSLLMYLRAIAGPSLSFDVGGLLIGVCLSAALASLDFMPSTWLAACSCQVKSGENMELSTSLDWVFALVSLTSLELVLGIDNVVLLTILVERLPEGQKQFARRVGLSLALIFRVALLSMVAWLIQLSEPLFFLGAKSFSVKDLILIVGGSFLLAKATTEIFHFVEARDSNQPEKRYNLASTYATAHVIGQIVVFDLVFSLDSVLTAVGVADDLSVMVIAVILAAVLMIVFAGKIGDFVENNPAIKMLALSFLVLIGVLLAAEGLGSHVDKGYIYFAMAFSLVIELMNRRRHKKASTSTK